MTAKGKADVGSGVAVYSCSLMSHASTPLAQTGCELLAFWGGGVVVTLNTKELTASLCLLKTVKYYYKAVFTKGECMRAQV
jgi:hypothetical protein